MTLAKFIRSSNLRKLTTAGVVAAAGTVLVLSVLGFLLIGARVRTAAAVDETRSLRRQIAEARSAVDTANRLTSGQPTEAASPVGMLQNHLQRVADAEGADLTEYQASGDVAPFLTRYAKVTEDKGWDQVSVRATIEGSAATVFSTLARLDRSPVPLEIDSLDLSRRSTDGKGVARVSAHVEMRVLTQEASK